MLPDIPGIENIVVKICRTEIILYAIMLDKIHNK